MTDRNLPSGSQRQPNSEPKAAQLLLKQFDKLTQRMEYMGHALDMLHERMRGVAQLVGRTAYMMMTMVGLPRPVRGDLFDLVTSGRSFLPFGSTTAQGRLRSSYMTTLVPLGGMRGGSSSSGGSFGGGGSGGGGGRGPSFTPDDTILRRYEKLVEQQRTLNQLRKEGQALDAQRSTDIAQGRLASLDYQIKKLENLRQLLPLVAAEEEKSARRSAAVAKGRVDKLAFLREELTLTQALGAAREKAIPNLRKAWAEEIQNVMEGKTSANSPRVVTPEEKAASQRTRRRKASNIQRPFTATDKAALGRFLKGEEAISADVETLIGKKDKDGNVVAPEQVIQVAWQDITKGKVGPSQMRWVRPDESWIKTSKDRKRFKRQLQGAANLLGFNSGKELHAFLKQQPTAADLQKEMAAAFGGGKLLAGHNFRGLDLGALNTAFGLDLKSENVLDTMPLAKASPFGASHKGGFNLQELVLRRMTQQQLADLSKKFGLPGARTQHKFHRADLDAMLVSGTLLPEILRSFDLADLGPDVHPDVVTNLGLQSLPARRSPPQDFQDPAETTASAKLTRTPEQKALLAQRVKSLVAAVTMAAALPKPLDYGAKKTQDVFRSITEAHKGLSDPTDLGTGAMDRHAANAYLLRLLQHAKVGLPPSPGPKMAFFSGSGGTWSRADAMTRVVRDLTTVAGVHVPGVMATSTSGGRGAPFVLPKILAGFGAGLDVAEYTKRVQQAFNFLRRRFPKLVEPLREVVLAPLTGAAGLADWSGRKVTIGTQALARHAGNPRGMVAAAVKILGHELYHLHQMRAGMTDPLYRQSPHGYELMAKMAGETAEAHFLATKGKATSPRRPGRFLRRFAVLRELIEGYAGSEYGAYASRTAGGPRMTDPFLAASNKDLRRLLRLDKKITGADQGAAAASAAGDMTGAALLIARGNRLRHLYSQLETRVGVPAGMYRDDAVANARTELLMRAGGAGGQPPRKPPAPPAAPPPPPPPVPPSQPPGGRPPLASLPIPRYNYYGTNAFWNIFASTPMMHPGTNPVPAVNVLQAASTISLRRFLAAIRAVNKWQDEYLKLLNEGKVFAAGRAQMRQMRAQGLAQSFAAAAGFLHPSLPGGMIPPSEVRKELLRRNHAALGMAAPPFTPVPTPPVAQAVPNVPFTAHPPPTQRATAGTQLANAVIHSAAVQNALAQSAALARMFTGQGTAADQELLSKSGIVHGMGNVGQGTKTYPLNANAASTVAAVAKVPAKSMPPVRSLGVDIGNAATSVHKWIMARVSPDTVRGIFSGVGGLLGGLAGGITAMLPGLLTGGLATPVSLMTVASGSAAGVIAGHKGGNWLAQKFLDPAKSFAADFPALGRLFSSLAGGLKAFGANLFGLANSPNWKRFSGAIGQFVDQMGLHAGFNLLMLSGASMSAVGAASPHTFAMVEGSARLLAAAFGSLLIPAAVSVSVSLLNAANFFLSFGDVGKQVISGILKYGLVTLAAVTAVSKLVALIRTLGTAFLFMKEVVGAVSGALGGPFKAALFAAAAAVLVYVGYKSYDLYKRAREAEKSQVPTSEDVKDVMMLPEDKRKEAAKKRLEELTQQEEVMKGHVARRTGLTTDNAKTALLTMVPIFGAANLINEANQLVQDKEALQGIRRRKTGLQMIMEGKTGGLGEERKETLGQLLAIMGAAGVKQQPLYTSLEESYRKVQVTALGTDPVEEAIRKMHEDTLKKMLSEVEKIGEGVPEFIQALLSARGVF